MPNNRPSDLSVMAYGFEDRLKHIQVVLSHTETDLQKYRDDILLDIEKIQRIAREVLEATDQVKLRLLRDHPAKPSPFAGHIKFGQRRG